MIVNLVPDAVFHVNRWTTWHQLRTRAWPAMSAKNACRSWKIGENLRRSFSLCGVKGRAKSLVPILASLAVGVPWEQITSNLSASDDDQPLEDPPNTSRVWQTLAGVLR